MHISTIWTTFAGCPIETEHVTCKMVKFTFVKFIVRVQLIRCYNDITNTSIGIGISKLKLYPDKYWYWFEV